MKNQQKSSVFNSPKQNVSKSRQKEQSHHKESNMYQREGDNKYNFKNFNNDWELTKKLSSTGTARGRSTQKSTKLIPSENKESPYKPNKISIIKQTDLSAHIDKQTEPNSSNSTIKRKKNILQNFDGLLKEKQKIIDDLTDELNTLKTQVKQAKNTGGIFRYCNTNFLSGSNSQNQKTQKSQRNYPFKSLSVQLNSPPKNRNLKTDERFTITESDKQYKNISFLGQLLGAGCSRINYRYYCSSRSKSRSKNNNEKSHRKNKMLSLEPAKFFFYFTNSSRAKDKQSHYASQYYMVNTNNNINVNNNKSPTNLKHNIASSPKPKGILIKDFDKNYFRKNLKKLIPFNLLTKSNVNLYKKTYANNTYSKYIYDNFPNSPKQKNNKKNNIIKNIYDNHQRSFSVNEMTANNKKYYHNINNSLKFDSKIELQHNTSERSTTNSTKNNIDFQGLKQRMENLLNAYLQIINFKAKNSLFSSTEINCDK